MPTERPRKIAPARIAQQVATLDFTLLALLDTACHNAAGIGSSKHEVGAQAQVLFRRDAHRVNELVVRLRIVQL